MPAPDSVSKLEQIAYLRSTLIPDLIESGRLHTAEDFEVCCRFMEGAKLVTLPESEDKIVAFCNEWKKRG